MPWLTIILLILLLWSILVLYVSRRGSKKFRPYGPAIMWSTTRGREKIESWGKRGFWAIYGDASIIITIIFMVFTFVLLIWEAFLVIGIPRSMAPSPLAALGLPGINPFIPITYGILAIVVAVVIHELFHGLQSANNGIEIKSMGVLFFIVPVGAFVEPDEENLRKSSRRVRMRVFSSGPSTNIVASFAFLVLFLLLMSTVSSPSTGALITYSGNGDLMPGDLVLSIDGKNITSAGEIGTINIDPGKQVPLVIERKSSKLYATVISGLWVNAVLQNSPAWSAGIKPGEVLISVNGILMKNSTAFNSFMDNTTAGEMISLKFIFNGEFRYYNVTLIDKYKFYSSYAPNYNSPNFKGRGFLGVSMAYMNATYSDPSQIMSLLSNPFKSGIFQGFIFLITLPFIGLSPFPSYFNSVYLTPFIPAVFWPLANVIYWIFWINLMLGLTNALPLLPLDGGYVLRDFISGVLEKYRVMKPEKIASGISIALSILVLFLILWQFIYPRIGF